MSEETKTENTDGPATTGVNEAAEATEVIEKNAAPDKPKDPVKRWTLIILVVCVALLVWYLRADRVTPHTSQARVHALVVPIAPEISGTITDVFVSNNQQVAKGQQLFQIDIERYQLGVTQAQAVLDQARQAQGAARANVDAVRASLESAKAGEEKTRLDAVRMRNIRKQDPGAISQRRIESAEAALASATARVTASQAGLVAAIEQLGEPGDQNAAVQQAQAGLDAATLNLESATVLAPEKGVVTGVQLDRGNFAGAGQAQMTFIATHNIWIQADYKENNLGNLDPGDRVGIVFDVLPGRVFSGKVREIGFGVSLDNSPLGSLPTIKNDASWLRSAQRCPVLIDFDLPVNGGGITRLKVGSQASVTVYTGTHRLFNLLGRIHMWVLSKLTYAYCGHSGTGSRHASGGSKAYSQAGTWYRLVPAGITDRHVATVLRSTGIDLVHPGPAAAGTHAEAGHRVHRCIAVAHDRGPCSFTISEPRTLGWRWPGRSGAVLQFLLHGQGWLTRDGHFHDHRPGAGDHNRQCQY